MVDESKAKSEKLERKERLKTLGVIMGYHATSFTASKIRRFMETDPQYHLERRIRNSHGPLVRNLRFLCEHGLVGKRSRSGRIVYIIQDWKKLEDYYHALLWEPEVSSRARST